MRRDFTFVADIVEGVRRVLDRVPEPDPNWSGERPDPGTSTAPYRLYNIGNHNPVELLHLIATLEQALGVTALKDLLPMQPGDVPATFADASRLASLVGASRAHVPLREGIARFVAWYAQYYGVELGTPA